MLHCQNAEIAGVRIKTHDCIVHSLHMALMGLKGIESSWGPAATVQQAWQELPLPPEIAKLQPDGLVRLEARKQVFIVEVARTMDHGLHFDFNRAAEKLHKYEPLLIIFWQPLWRSSRVGQSPSATL